MPRVRLNLGFGSYQNPTIPFSAQRCINLYPSIAEAASWSSYHLKTTAGIRFFGTAGSGISRGSIEMDGILYVINGTTLLSVDEFGTPTSRGTVTGIKRVSMTHNGDKLCIVVPGGDAFVYVASTTTFTQITDLDFRISDTVCFKDGFYIFTETDSNIFFNSALNDPLTFDPLDFGTAELAPDGIVGCHVDHDEVYILGENTTEVFQNVGGAGFPFQRIPGASFEKGSHSKYSPIQWEDGFYFIGGGKNEQSSFWKARGTANPVKISTDAIDHELQLFTTEEIAEGFSFTYSLEGVSFIGFTIRSVNIPSRTFIYNLTASQFTRSNIWFEQQTGVTDNAWRIQSLVKVYNKLIVSDVIDGRLGFLDTDTFTEYGDVLIREKVTPPFAGDGSSLFLHTIELSVDAGRGTISGQGADPVVEMDFSDDGARTFSFRTLRSLGKIGEYFRRVEWRRLGRIPAQRVFRFRVTDPVSVSFIKLEAQATRGE